MPKLLLLWGAQMKDAATGKDIGPVKEKMRARVLVIPLMVVFMAAVVVHVFGDGMLDGLEDLKPKCDTAASAEYTKAQDETLNATARETHLRRAFEYERLNTDGAKCGWWKP